MNREIHCMHFDKEKKQDTISYNEKFYSTKFGKADCKCIKCGEVFNTLDIDKVSYNKNKATLCVRDVRDIVNTMKLAAAAMGKEIPYKYTELLNIIESLPEDAGDLFEDFCQYENEVNYLYSAQKESMLNIFTNLTKDLKVNDPSLTRYKQSLEDMPNDSK